MSGGHSEIDKLINHFDGGGTRESFKKGGKPGKEVAPKKELGEMMKSKRESSYDKYKK